VKALNEEFLPGNTCFGCGLANPEGMQIRIYRDGDDALTGTFNPRSTMGGFPEIVHGGLQFTALDCMAGWCCLMLRGKHQPLMPLTKSASMRFLRPARLGAGTLSLRAAIIGSPATPKDPFVIKTSLVDGAGNALSEADFDYVMLPEDRFKRAVSIDALPDSYRRHFGQLA
jgi:acyl-coenzyme A thioesterase PaaI-like protein